MPDTAEFLPLARMIIRTKIPGTRAAAQHHQARHGHPPAGTCLPGRAQIRRSLVTGATLWTLSGNGLKANDLATLVPLGWVPFGQ